MRHKKNKVTLDRKTAGRRSLIANLVESLVLYEKIKTTKAKAKVVRSAAERLITRAKSGSLADRRRIAAVLYTKNSVRKLMEVLGPRYKDRKGGYTRITMIQNRVGDGAEEAVVELI